jgi:ABC-type transport system substrate-binding protein
MRAVAQATARFSFRSPRAAATCRAERAAPVRIGGDSGTELAQRQVLRRGNSAEPQSLDPHKSDGGPESNLQRDLFEGLTNDVPDGGIEPGVARSWDISDDGLVYVFRNPGQRALEIRNNLPDELAISKHLRTGGMGHISEA